MRRDVSVADGPRVGRTESSESTPKHDEGAVCATWVRCGRPWCRCMHGGPKHGPYYVRYWWQDGRRRKRYVPQQDATQAITACAERRAIEHERRARIEAARQEWRGHLALIREVERGER
jgi:hypothetical protein